MGKIVLVTGPVITGPNMVVDGLINCKEFNLKRFDETVTGIDLNGGTDKMSCDYISPVSAEVLQNYIAYFGEERVISILLKINSYDCIKKALDIERAKEVPDYKEICKTFLDESKYYSEEATEPVVTTGVVQYDDSVNSMIEESKMILRKHL